MLSICITLVSGEVFFIHHTFLGYTLTTFPLLGHCLTCSITASYLLRPTVEIQMKHYFKLPAVGIALGQSHLPHSTSPQPHKYMLHVRNFYINHGPNGSMVAAHKNVKPQNQQGGYLLPPPSPGELFNTIQNWKGPEKNCFSLSFINILLTFLRKQIKKYDIITFQLSFYVNICL